MQLSSLHLYSTEGDITTIDFRLGELNIITGVSRKGKSVLVKLVDYCLGRSEIPTSAGNVEKSLSWVGATWQFEDGGQAFVGRPLPKGQKENDRALLLIGDTNLEIPTFPFESNMNTNTMRQILGQRIGIGESNIEPPSGSLRHPLRTNLGHAAFLCIQNQDEISSSTKIFHRSGERGVDDALRDTIPYFLGAIPPDQALQKAILRQENRKLQRLERDLRSAEEANESLDDELLTLHSEAVSAGLAEPFDASRQPSRSEVIVSLHRASRDDSLPSTALSATHPQDAERSSQGELTVAEDHLDQLLRQRRLLIDESDSRSNFEDALAIQVGRLTSLDLLPLTPDATDGGAGENAGLTSRTALCPICGHEAADPTSAEMRRSLEKLSAQLESVREAAPARSAAFDDVSRQISAAKHRVTQARQAVEASFAASSSVGGEARRRRDFTRGRIAALVSRVPVAEESGQARLREKIDITRGTIEELQHFLSDDTARERLTTRLNGVARDLTKYAQELGLEHSDKNVRIDLAELTVVAEVDDDPIPLHRIGSAENWIGYHVASHLALHQSFIRHDRPVPRVLVLDQPSQGHYPSQKERRTDAPNRDADDRAVRDLFKKMHEFVEENAGKFQIIVVDHADFDEDWFSASVIQDWRDESQGPVGLVPSAWIAQLGDVDGGLATS